MFSPFASLSPFGHRLVAVGGGGGGGDITTGLDNWWKFDEGSGGSAGDSGASVNGGNVTGGWGTGQIGTYDLTVTGGTGMEANANVTLGTSYTVACWAKAASLSPLAGIWRCPRSPGQALYLWFGNVLALYDEAGTGAHLTSFQPTIGTWFHVAVVVSGGTSATIYIDGASVLTPAVSWAGGTGLMRVGFDGFAQNWDGEIDDFRVYGSRALSAADITTLVAYR